MMIEVDAYYLQSTIRSDILSPLPRKYRVLTEIVAALDRRSKGAYGF